jgi:UDP-N-acetylmuramoyl-L-alanyl-D-glutamate--2,6-diaminopimelate ligase
MKLSELVKDVQPLAVEGPLDREITGIAYDSRRVLPGHLFVAMRGERTDGHQFVDAAIDRGAAAVVLERDSGLSPRATRIRVQDARQTLARAAAAFYEHPSQRLRVVGVTGTNGKTTTAFMMKAIWEAAGTMSGLLGTVQYEIGERVIPAARTTPESVEIQEMMRQMLQAGCGAVSMEVSSHALAQHRVDEVDFDVAVFTNLSQDHLDYHGTMENYFAAKSLLFRHLGRYEKDGVAVVNVDDSYGRRLAASLGGENAVLTYGVSDDAAVGAREIRVTRQGTTFLVRAPQASFPVTLPLLGRYNIHNALGAIGAALAVGVPPEAIQRGLRQMRPVPGRLERVAVPDPVDVYVDYAHTPAALRNVLLTVGELTRGRLIVVFGCGGDRDKGKRQPMGAAAAELADFAIITSDNPRTENPADILRQVQAGFPPKARNYMVIEDRREAIERALDIAREGDTVLIAGKGHEAYQEFADTVVPFNDRQVVEDYYAEFGKRWSR